MMKTYSSVKEALRSGIIIIADDKEGGSNSTTFRRRHTVDGPSHSQQTFISSTTIRLNPDNAPTETLDVSQYTQEDLKRLKEEDPFFYYSIPEIHLRSYRMDSLDEEEDSSVDEERDHAEIKDYHEESQDDEINEGGSEETRSIKQQQQGNVKNIMNPSHQEKRPRSLSTITHQQTTQGRRATLPPNFLQQSAAAAAASASGAFQMPIHQGPVTRSRRVSVEAHPYLILESMLSEDEEDDDDMYHQFGLLNNVSLDDEDSDEEEDVLLRILSANLMLGERRGEEKEEE